MSNSDSPKSVSNLKAPSKIARPSGGIPKPASNLPKLSSTSTTSISSNQANLTQTDHDLTVSNENLNDFKINDRVWVNGTKSGCIAFIGETQFKEGVWAGVILDTNDGKNNGTLNNVTYFKTEENRGVFCRLNKLSRTQLTEEVANSTIAEAPEEKSEPERADGLKVGSRVVIINSDGSSKLGILRFIGTTDFAKGEWVGVELDEKLGKNDGSVANKRYFQCEPMHGVFAPSQKVQLYNPNAASAKKPVSTTSRIAAGAVSTAPKVKPIGLSKQNSGSQESLISEKSSMYSTASGINKATAQRKSLVKPVRLLNILKIDGYDKFFFKVTIDLSIYAFNYTSC